MITLTLTDLHTSARAMGYSAWLADIGGNVRGLHFRHPSLTGPLFLITLDDGNESGTTWTVGVADGSNDSGELPITSDADQTMRDALAWTWGEDASSYVDRCPACGEFIDYCQGHGEINDPDGFAILAAHDDGEHEACNLAGCDDAERKCCGTSPRHPHKGLCPEA